MSLLRPGLHVTRRDGDHLQVGVDPPWRAVLPDAPDVRRLLDDLLAGRSPAPETAEGRRALAELDRTGMLAPPPPSSSRGTVSVAGAGSAREAAARALREAGCTVAEDDAAHPATSGLDLIVLAGEVPRAEADARVRTGRTHLIVGAGARGWTVGPFVVPGTTSCLRCVDAHLCEHDPRRALVVEQLAGRPAAPADPELAVLATMWAVRDVLTYLDGGEPSTWSATVEVGHELPPSRRTWARHPHCGCAWA
ncbi:MAG: hypothetical protein WBP61_12525 [Nocardioides sp.]